MTKAIALLAGRWHGAAWVELEPGQRSDLDVTLVVQPKADGSALLVDVLFTINRPGLAPSDAHSEIAVLYFDEKAAAYGFDVFFHSGLRQTLSGQLDGAMLRLVGPLPGGGSLRLTVDRTHPDEWRETGERSSDGVHWRTYYDSRLRRPQD
jgi:hypothetical protein